MKALTVRQPWAWALVHGCGQCGGDVDEDWTCIDCGYNPLEDDYEPEDVDLLEPADLDVMVELGPAGREALG